MKFFTFLCFFVGLCPIRESLGFSTIRQPYSFDSSLQRQQRHQQQQQHSHQYFNSERMSIISSSSSSSSLSQLLSTRLYASTPPRLPRRMLKKREGNGERRRQRQQRNRRQFQEKVDGGTTPAQSFDWETTERRPLISSIRKETGEDYWIDESELEQYNQAQKAMKQKSRKPLPEGAVSSEKLWSEVKAPYKQNWIGYFSVGIAILSAIIIKFPELLDQPTIRIPDL